MNRLSQYKYPSITLLNNYDDQQFSMSVEEYHRKISCIEKVLKENNVIIKGDIRAIIGPAFSKYYVEPVPGTRVAKYRYLAYDIAMGIGVTSVRVSICADGVCFEIPNEHRSIVPLRSLLEDKEFRESTAELPLAIGSTSERKAKVIDLVDAPHILMAGATKQGKTVCLHSMVASLLFSKRPDEVKFVFIDPKMVDFSGYRTLPKHYLCVLSNAPWEERESAIVTSTQEADNVLAGLCAEMEDRYNTLLRAKMNNVRNYNRQSENKLPYIVCFINEYADLTVTIGANKQAKELSKRITSSIIRIAQKGRAVGIHLILGTQRPSTDVITGPIKSNFPTRIAFRTSSSSDSTTILDMPGAESLIGEGDMLLSTEMNLERIQGGYISNEEVLSLVEHIKVSCQALE